MNMNICVYLIPVAVALPAHAALPVVEKPDCGSWPENIALSHLENAGLTNGRLDFAKTKVLRLASEPVGKNLWRQVHHVTFTEKSGKTIEVVTRNDASEQECSMSGVEVYVVSRRLGDAEDLGDAQKK